MKRISFNTYDISHLYELSVEHAYACKGCYECEHLMDRMEKFIGKKETNRIKKVINKRPYCRGIK